MPSGLRIAIVRTNSFSKISPRSPARSSSIRRPLCFSPGDWWYWSPTHVTRSDGAAVRSTRLVAEREIRLAEKARFEAMIRADLPALDTLLGSDLSYTHTDGDRQTRSQFVAMLRSNELAYLSAQPESVVVRVYGTTVLADGRAHMRVRSGGKEIAFTIRFLEAYVHRRGRWELVAWQSTRIGDVSQ